VTQITTDHLPAGTQKGVTCFT